MSIGLLPNMAPQLIPGALAWLREAGRAVQLNVREDTLDRMLAQAQRHGSTCSCAGSTRRR